MKLTPERWSIIMINMNITKCDICKKIIRKDAGSVHIGLGNIFSNHVEICCICGESVLRLLRDNKLMKKENYGK